MRAWNPREIESQLLVEIAALLRLPESALEAKERFTSYGLDSARVTSLAARMSTLLERSVSPTSFWRYPTARELSMHLAGAAVATPEKESGAAGSSARRAASVPGRSPEGRGYELAVVGMGCRFPGGADPRAFWELLERSGDAISDAPADRWDVDSFFDADPSVSGKTTTRWGGFVEDATCFDPRAFGIAPREAEHMDPQQRLALQVAWTTLEDAGIPLDTLRDSKVGVFVGAMWTEYGSHLVANLDDVTAHTVTGLDTSIIPARISYAFGLAGPSMTVNTACSSSLVAVHLACQSILRGESDMALAGGVSLMLSPYSSVAMSKFGAMSPRGRCRAFDAGADGYVRGEGCGFVLLKPLQQALKDGDRIHCIVRGSAINNDGFSNGLTAPNPRAQEAVILAAGAQAGIAAADLHYVETHGPGTILGDPLEAGSLGRTLGRGRVAERPMLIGSVKTNIGHLEAAAGIAGLIKVSLALSKREVPPNLHFSKPNPHIPFQELGLRVNTKHASWPEPDSVATAGINSFGFGGTNCHLVAQARESALFSVLPIAAESKADLTARAHSMSELVRSRDRWTIDEVCRGAAGDVGSGKFRKALRAGSTDTLRADKEAIAASAESPAGKPKVVFVCPGQGGQWVGMCRSLIAEEPVFRAAISECATAIAAQAGWSLWDLLFDQADGASLARAEFVQPMVFAVQVALGAQLRSWGITPDVVIGHSMGEVASAHLVGILSLEDATRIICERSRLASATGGEGGMALVSLSVAAVREALTEFGEAMPEFAESVAVAACNSHETTVISGDLAAVEAFTEQLQRSGIYAAQINVDFASHCFHMDPLRAPLLDALASVRPYRACGRMISTVTTEELSGLECGPVYWSDNIREPVQFMQVVDQCLRDGPTVFVELSPHPVLAQSLVKQIEHVGAVATVLAVMRRDENERLTLTSAVGRLFELGVDVDWVRVAGPGRVVRSEALGPVAERPACIPSVAPQVLALSARSAVSLAELAAAHRAQLSPCDGPVRFLDDLAFTASTRRSQNRFRLAVVGSSAEDLIDGLDAFAAGKVHPAVFEGEAATGSRREPTWLFPELDLQWTPSRLGLASNAAFRRAFERAQLAIAGRTGWVAGWELGADGGNPAQRSASLEAIWFATQVALAEVWRSRGAVPRAMVGRGIGELAAACVAGALSLDDAARILHARSQVIARLEPSAALAVLAINGRDPAIIGLSEALHSPRQELERLLLGLTPGKAVGTLYSSVEGRPVVGFELGARYWGFNLGLPAVKFQAVLELLAEQGCSEWIELSPVPSTHAEIVRASDKAECTLSPLVVPPKAADAGTSLLLGIAALYSRGCSVDLKALQASGGRCVDLPPYPFERQRFWPTKKTAAVAASAAIDPSGSALRPEPAARVVSLLGQRLDTGAVRALYQNQLSTEAQPFLRDHVVYDTVVVSGAQYIVSMLAAASQEGGFGSLVALSELELVRSLSVSGVESVVVQTVLDDADAGALRIKYVSRENPSKATGLAAWRTHCRAVASRAEPSADRTRDLAQTWQRCGEVLKSAVFYGQWQSAGYNLGPAFRGIERVARRDGEAIAQIDNPSAGRADGLPISCGLVDSLFQLVATACPGGPAAIAATNHIYAPVALRKISVLKADFTPPLTAHAVVSPPDPMLHTEGLAEVIIGDVALMDAAGDVVLALDGLCLRRAPRVALLNEASPASVRDLIHTVRWTEAPAVKTIGLLPTHTAWLIVTAERVGPTCRLLLNRLVDAGIRHELVQAGTGVSSDVLREQLDGALALVGTELSQVVFFGSSAQIEELGRDSSATPQVSCTALLELIRSLTGGDGASQRNAQLHVVTRGAQSAWLDVPANAHGARRIGELASCLDATLWGLCNTLSVEHPELQPKRIDLEVLAGSPTQSNPAPEFEALWTELLARDAEDQIAFRNGLRLVPRLSRHAAGLGPEGLSQGNCGIEPDATQLITGGNGGLGLELARWLVKQGATTVVLASRSAPSAAALQVRDDLERQGARIVFAALDVSELRSVEQVLADIARDLPRLRGVFHAAGLLEDGLLHKQTWATFQSVLAPKLAGSWNLDHATAGLSLQHFVVFSSAASVLGLAGQANYAAANAFLDALVHERRARGLPGLSVNWGPWSEVGLAAAQDRRGNRLASRGLASLSPEQGFEILDRALSAKETQLVAMSFDAERWRMSNPQVKNWPLLEQMAPQLAESRTSTRPPVALSDVREKLTRARTTRQRIAVLVSHLKGEVSRVLRLASGSVPQDAPFVSLGFDSLMSQELRNGLASQLSVKMPATLLWNFPTIDALADELERLVTEASVAAAAGEAAGGNPTRRKSGIEGLLERTREIANLGDEEASLLLSRRLKTSRNGSTK